MIIWFTPLTFYFIVPKSNEFNSCINDYLFSIYLLSMYPLPSLLFRLFFFKLEQMKVLFFCLLEKGTLLWQFDLKKKMNKKIKSKCSVNQKQDQKKLVEQSGITND